MSMLSFFPWITVSEKLVLGEFELIPYNINSTSEEKTEKEINRILGAYHLHSSLKIKSATLIKFSSKDLTADLSDEEKMLVLRLMEVLALCCLSERAIFSYGDYSNFDCYQAIIQGFIYGQTGVSVLTRRRDGQTTNFSSDEYFKVLKPEHVVVQHRLRIDDKDYLNSLVSLISHESWKDFETSIYYFLRGNTDSNSVSQEIELVFIVGAFEKLLDSNSKAIAVSKDFNEALSSRLLELESLILGEKIANRGKYRDLKSIREVWMRDFYETRGKLAHGSKEIRGAVIWTLAEHLLLASFVFHFVLKIKLERFGLYRLSEDDLMMIYYFDKRVRSGDLFLIETKKSGEPVFGWSEAIDYAFIGWDIEKESIIRS